MRIWNSYSKVSGPVNSVNFMLRFDAKHLQYNKNTNFKTNFVNTFYRWGVPRSVILPHELLPGRRREDRRRNWFEIFSNTEKMSEFNHNLNDI